MTAAACGGSGGFRTAAELPDAPRRPDGVAIDPAMSPPEAQHQADGRDALVTLRAPLGVDLALGAVANLIRRVVREDIEGLEAVFTPDAQVSASGVGGHSGANSRPVAWWNERFKRLDYTKLAGEPVYREAEVEIYRAEDDLAAAPAAVIRSEQALGETDVVVRVPIASPRVGAERLFGDELLLWLRRDGERYRVYRIVEDFQLP